MTRKKALQRSEIDEPGIPKMVIVHNLEWYDLSIATVLQEWKTETKELTVYSLCSYIVDMDPVSFFAVTEEQYLELSKAPRKDRRRIRSLKMN